MATDPIDHLRIASPCPTSWEAMEGDERVRHCAVCRLNVYNIAEMTRDEVRAVIARSEGRLCVRLYRRGDGTVLTRDCPTGLRALRRRASRAAAAIVAALLSLPAFALGLPWRKARPKADGSEVTLTTEHVATTQPSVFTGVVAFSDGPVPGVTVTLRDEATGRDITTVTDAKGEFTIHPPSDGIYRADVTLAGFGSAKIAHLELRSGVVTHANVILKMDHLLGETITVGAAGPDPLTQNSISTTFSQSFIDKLPF